MNVIGVVPDHVPLAAVSVAPSATVPVTDGSAVFTGGLGGARKAYFWFSQSTIDCCCAAVIVPE